MPATYNGIGTHYYGKKNIQKRVAPCHSCGQSVELVSYDTRVWFVFLFIPLIPLGRKRILDYCPSCTRHFAVEADKWETARQLEVSGAQEKFRTEPTADHAIAVHQQLVQFHQLDEAAAFQRTMAEKFPENAKVHAYLGAALTHLGKLAEAAPCFVRALELRPDLPEARVGVALARIREGKLDEARKLLDFLEQPGASKLYSLEPLDTLARGYQNANRHDDALSVFAALLKELPKLGEEKWFRTLVARSEKGSGRESLLPKLKFSWKRFFTLQRSPQPVGGPPVTWRGLLIVGIIVGIAAVVFLISNEYIRRHRTLYIVSGFQQPALVEVRGVGSVRTSRGEAQLPLQEGRYHATITGPIRQELDFEIRSGYWSRWFDHPAWVLNVGGSAILQLQTAVYAAEPPPVEYSFHYGEPFLHFDRVTDPFRELPQKLQMKSGETRTLVGLDLLRREPTALFFYLNEQRKFSEALRLAEWRLRLQPEDEDMLGLYVRTAQAQREVKRAEKFLHDGLTNRPVAIQWHRFYQGLRRETERGPALAAEYDAQLAAEPTNSALLYLRGRVAASRAESRTWFERARDADPNNAYALYALGYERLATADLAGARPLLARAVALRPKQADFTETLFDARMGLGEFAALEQDLRRQLAAEPPNYATIRRLCDVLVAAGRRAEAEQAARQFEAQAQAQAREQAREPNAELRRHLLYALGDFDALEKDAAGERSAAANYARYTALVELGRLDEATKLLSPQTETAKNPFQLLNLALAWRLAGNTDEAARWQSQATKMLARADGDLARAGALLQTTTPPTQAELDEVAIGVEAKRSLLTALAQLHPSKRADFAAQARRLNLDWSFPHHLIERATAEKP